MSSDPARIIAVVVLALVAAALLCAGLYALIGKPSTHEGKKRKQHIVNGFQLGGGIVLGTILMGSFVACSQIALGIVQSSRLSRVAVFVVALTSFALIFSLIKLWAKHFAGWVGYSVLNGLLMISSGHLVNNPSVLVPRWWSISVTVLAFVSALVCVRFTKTNLLNRVDQAALMFWVLAFTLAVDVESTHAAYRQQFGLAAMFFGCLGLVMAWFYGRTLRNHKRRRTTQMHQLAQQGH